MGTVSEFASQWSRSAAGQPLPCKTRIIGVFTPKMIIRPFEPPFRELSNDVWVDGSGSSILYGKSLLTAVYRPTSRVFNIVVLYILMSVS